jgi:nicotinamidase-related amidase
VSLTIPNPERSALIVVDVQNDFVLPGAPAEIPGTMAVVPQIARLLHAFRAARRPIAHLVRLYKADGSNVDLCRREKIAAGARIVIPGTPGAQIVSALLPTETALDAPTLLNGHPQWLAEDEWVFYKPRWGAFYQTSLEPMLKDWRVDTLVFCGCNFPNCPRTSIYEASERDFRVLLVADAVSGLYEQGCRELEAIGVRLQTTDQCLGWLAGF